MLCVCVILLPPDLIYSDFALMGSSTGGPDCSACSCPVAGDHSSSKAGSKRPHHSFGHDCSLLQKVCPAKIQQQNANVQELPAHVLMSRKSQQLVMSPLLNSLGQVQLQRRRALKQNSSPVSTIVRCDARRCDVRKQAPPTNGSLVSVRSMRYL